MKLRKNKKGFTLVELVVVIAILAVLAGTATVATIAILNNSRKTPVTDAASSIKNQMSYYYFDDSFKDDKAGFTSYLAQSMPELVVDTNAGTNVPSSAPTDGKIHVLISTASNLKGSTWSVIVYTQYFKQKVTYNWDATNKGFKGFDLSDVKKYSENF